MITQLAMKFSSNEDQKVMTLITTKSVRKEMSVTAARNSDRKSILAIQNIHGHLSFWLVFCQLQLMAALPLE